MTFVRSIGRWTMTALVINCIIGSGIFGLPGELTHLLGRASPIAMVLAALGIAVIIACIAEVASQFSEPGGPYLYVRTAFGRFLGMQVGWFHLLGDVVGVAGCAALFVNYLATWMPSLMSTSERVLLLAIVIAIPAAANYFGVRNGAILSNLLTVAKLSPLVLLIVFGGIRFLHHPHIMPTSEMASPGLSNWVRATVFLLFVYAGPEGAVIASGEIKDPRHTIPFSLAAGLLACAAIFTFLQFIVVATVGVRPTDQPLADTASVLLGGGGAAFISLAVMMSTYGWISGVLLYGPRLIFALAANGDCPAFLARIHPRLHTPTVAIAFYAVAAWALAFSGTYLWLTAITSGAIAILYTGTCAALIRLRTLRPKSDALRVPMGPLLSIAGILICAAVIVGLKRNELVLLSVPALIATTNWLLSRKKHLQLRARGAAVADRI